MSPDPRPVQFRKVSTVIPKKIPVSFIGEKILAIIVRKWGAAGFKKFMTLLIFNAGRLHETLVQPSPTFLLIVLDLIAARAAANAAAAAWRTSEPGLGL